ncbi:MAG: hypothetical protein AAB225_17845, partial [Acidobacteriota bacterium]
TRATRPTALTHKSCYRAEFGKEQGRATPRWRLPMLLSLSGPELGSLREHLSILLAALHKTRGEVVAIFDGLDRLFQPEKFWDVVEHDFSALRQLKVSVIAAAPISILYGTGRWVSEHFDRVHHLPALMAAPESDELLRSVLEQRGGGDLLGPAEIELICSASGGVLRDLITLARDAGEEAYVAGRDVVRRGDVERAVHQLGLGYLRGLGPDQIAALLELERTHALDPTSSTNLALLVTRRVLEYSATNFRVHPALLPLVTQPEARIA